MLGGAPWRYGVAYTHAQAQLPVVLRRRKAQCVRVVQLPSSSAATWLRQLHGRCTSTGSAYSGVAQLPVVYWILGVRCGQC